MRKATASSGGAAVAPHHHSSPSKITHCVLFAMIWDVDLCLESFDRVVIPFHYFVKPKPDLAPSNWTFPFLRLSVELQLTVYEHCDAPTLFQLMRTCSRTRRATRKLFWEKAFADQWYHCPDYLLFERRIQTYTLPPHCPDFASRITNVEIDLLRIETGFLSVGKPPYDEIEEYHLIEFKDFWSKVAKVFPSLKRLVLTGLCPTNVEPPSPNTESETDYATIAALVSCAPAHLDTYIAFGANVGSGARAGKGRRHTLWRAPPLPTDTQPEWQWEMLDDDWSPDRVLLPDRKWSVSPLGDFKTFYRKNHSALLEARGLEWLMVESYARYAVQDIIHCPRLDCSATFERRDLWKQHLSESDHGRFDVRRQSRLHPMKQLFCYKHTPQNEISAIEARQRRMDDKLIEAQKIELRVGYGWGPPSSEQRRLFEEEWIVQMKKESIYTPDRIDPVEQGLMPLHVWFDRTYVYHGQCSGTEGEHVCWEG